MYNDIAGFTERVLILLRDELDPDISPELVSNVLKKEQQIVENELMPVVQSIVNKEIRDMQTNGSQFFSTMSTSHHAELETISKTVLEKIQFDAIGEDDSQGVGQQQQQQQQQQQNFQKMEADIDDLRVCLAAATSLKTIRPLLSYWIHLPMHRDYIVTIIERFLFGFLTSARQELENVTWKLTSVDKKYLSIVRTAVEFDPFFVYYRSAVYDGYMTPEDLMSKRPKIKDGEFLPTERTATSASAEFDCWQDFWNVSEVKYKATSSIILKDFEKCQVIAAVAYGCDWLASKLSKRFVAAARRLTGTPRPSSVSIFAPRVAKFQKTTAAYQEMLAPLRKVFENGIKELSKVGKDCISILRGELEIACFHFLHLMSKLDFSNKLVKDSDGRPEPEALIAAWNQYILSFQDALLLTGHSSLIAVVFSPICRLAPRLLIRSVKSLFDTMSPRAVGDGSGDGKTKLLRAVLACQQGLSMLFESSRLDPVINRILQDILTEEFSKVRRFIQLLGCLLTELQSFISSSDQDFLPDELRTLWIHARDNLSQNSSKDFEDYWNLTSASKDPVSLPSPEIGPDVDTKNEEINSEEDEFDEVEEELEDMDINGEAGVSLI